MPPPCFLCPTTESWPYVQPWRAHSASVVFTEVTHLQEKRKKEKKNWADLYFRLARADTPGAQRRFLFFPWTCFTDASGRQNHVTWGHVSNSSAVQMLRLWALKRKRPILATILLFLWLASHTELVPLPCVDPLTPLLNLFGTVRCFLPGPGSDFSQRGWAGELGDFNPVSASYQPSG